MLVCAFRSGKRAGVRTRTVKVAEVLEHCARFADRWLEQDEWFLEELPAGATAFVETQLIIRPHNPSGPTPKPTHALARREKSEPDTVFIGVLSDAQYYKLRAEASAAWAARQAGVRERVEKMKPLASAVVRWEDLSPELRTRCHGAQLSIDECWIWKPDADASRERAAPYRAFYIHIKGPIPSGVILRHKCDNRQCMNPNHLEPGTAKDNVHDKMDRGRHPAQIVAKARAKRRQAYALRKALRGR